MLPEVVASQVAAGEVVERPASVIKELMENSLDAGARSLEVEVRGAGTGLLRVTVDGAGMDREDALMALERHATSKIASAADLAAVLTMGFRGEALPSIASVAEFTLRTRSSGATVGTEATVRGGKLVAAGAVTGVLSGIFGVGGGFLVVPALMFVTGVSLERALATSLVGIALISGAAFAANLFLEARALPVALTLLFLAGAIGGMIAGSRLKHYLPATALRRIFGVSVIALAVIIATKTLFFS